MYVHVCMYVLVVARPKCVFFIPSVQAIHSVLPEAPASYNCTLCNVMTSHYVCACCLLPRGHQPHRQTTSIHSTQTHTQLLINMFVTGLCLYSSPRVGKVNRTLLSHIPHPNSHATTHKWYCKMSPSICRYYTHICTYVECALYQWPLIELYKQTVPVCT